MLESSCTISAEELSSASNSLLRDPMLESTTFDPIFTDGTADRFNIFRSSNITPKTLQPETTQLTFVSNHRPNGISNLIFSTRRRLKVRRVLKEHGRENHEPGIVPVGVRSSRRGLFNDIRDEVLVVDINSSSSERIIHPVQGE